MVPAGARSLLVMLALFVSGSLAGCLHDRDELLEGKSCAPDGSCATRFVCRHTVCVPADEAAPLDGGDSSDAGGHDAGPRDAGSLDGGALADGGVDAGVDGGNVILCSAGEVRCSGSIPQTCDAAGQWVDGSQCPSVCIAGACAGSCVPGETVCSNRELLTCGEDGELPATGPECQFACASGECVGSCVPGEQRCDGVVPETCDAAGDFVSGSACASACLEGACVDCSPGDSRCNGLNIERCGETGQWALESACAFVCEEGAVACTGECSPGSAVCEGATLRECGADGYFTDTTCDYVCDQASGACAGECAPGSVSCGPGDVPRICGADGYFDNEPACGGGTPYCANASCTAPVVNGYPTLFPRNAPLTLDYVFARRISVTTGSAATRLGIHVTDASGGANFVLGLYANAGGAPGDLLGSTSPAVVSSGAQMLALQDEVPLAPGDYWVAATFDFTTPVGWADDNLDTTLHYLVRTYDGALPNVFVSGGSSTVDNYNFWIVARP